MASVREWWLPRRRGRVEELTKNENENVREVEKMRVIDVKKLVDVKQIKGEFCKERGNVGKCTSKS